MATQPKSPVNNGSDGQTENLNECEFSRGYEPSSHDVALKEADNPEASIEPQVVQLPQRQPNHAEEEEKIRQYETVVNEVEAHQQQTSIKDFAKLKVLGEGTYGRVLLVRHKKTEKYYAMKILKKKQIRQYGQVAHTLAERRILERMHHPFIVRLQYAFKDTERLYFVLNYCHGGELHFYIFNLQRFKLEFATFYAANILLALKYLHGNNIVYRDLKPENVLIDADGFAMLTDFGLSKENMNSGNQARSLVGTAEYLAPEILASERQYGFACDWWSFGVLLYEMISGLPPFYSTDKQVLFDKICNSELEFKKYHDRSTRDILHRLLIKDPTMRLSDPAEIMRHPFFAKIDWDAMMARNCTTPYKPEVQGPLDLSHFDNEQTNKPIDTPQSFNDVRALAETQASHSNQPCLQVATKADLYEQEEDDDEFGDDFYFAQSPTKDEFSHAIE